MDALYVCLFSNGLIKVGRTNNPASRIADHAERVACMGVELVQSESFECPDLIWKRELRLIDRCAMSASARFNIEWFAGLDYATVCQWASEAAQHVMTENQTRWTRIIADLRTIGVRQAQIADFCGTSPMTISRLALGQQDEPLYSLGERLIALHAAKAGESCRGDVNPVHAANSLAPV